MIGVMIGLLWCGMLLWPNGTFLLDVEQKRKLAPWRLALGAAVTAPLMRHLP
jgi:hypothetical protein